MVVAQKNRFQITSTIALKARDGQEIENNLLPLSAEQAENAMARGRLLMHALRTRDDLAPLTRRRMRSCIAGILGTLIKKRLPEVLKDLPAEEADTVKAAVTAAAQAIMHELGQLVVDTPVDDSPWIN